MLWTIIKSGFGIWRTNAREIIRLGLLPQLVAAALSVYVGWHRAHSVFVDLGNQSSVTGINEAGFFSSEVELFYISLIAAGLQVLAFSRWARLCLLGHERTVWWSLLPDAATLRAILALFQVLMVALVLAVPLMLLMFGVGAMMNRYGVASEMARFLPATSLAVAVYVGVRLACYAVIRAAGYRESLRSTWRLMGGAWIWRLLGALVFGGLAVLLVTSALGSAARKVFWSNLSFETNVQLDLLQRLAVGSGIVDFIVGLFFYPVLIAMIACTFKMALAARDAQFLDLNRLT